ncbi:MAG: diguanylate cyclase [bacterium]
MSHSILIVDDTWETREVIASILSTQDDYNIAFAENGQDALHRIRSQSPDLVITDISMPVMDGLELLDILTREFPALPVITFTGFGDLFSIKALEHGAEDCIFKPFDSRDLKLRVAKALKYSRLKKYQDLLEQKNDELRQLSSLDQLTQLPNRHQISDVLRKELARTKRYQTKLTGFLMNMLHFKTINEQYGHLQGDMVLREIAAVMQNNTRAVDHKFRFDGDMFLIVFPETSLEGAEVAAERLKLTIETMPIFSLLNEELLEDLKIRIVYGLIGYSDADLPGEIGFVSALDEACRQAKCIVEPVAAQ